MKRYRISFVGQIDLDAVKTPAAVAQAERLINAILERYGIMLGISGIQLPQPYK
jgi:hypothetical protein